MAYQRNPGIVAAEMDGDIVMMDVETGAYFGLEGIGSDIWSLLETPMTSAGLVARISENYDIAAESCRADIEHFLAEMGRRGLVLVS